LQSLLSGGSRPLAASEASFDKSDHRPEVGDGIHHIVGAGAVKDVIRPRPAAREVRRQRLGVGERKTEAITADGDADRPGARVGALGDADRRVVGAEFLIFARGA